MSRSSNPTDTTLYHDPQTMLYNLLLGISITADDKATIISPNLDVADSGYTNTFPGTGAATMYVKRDPFQQEIDENGKLVWMNPVPLVVVGPVRPISAAPTAGYGLLEVHRRIEVRVLTRDVTANSEGYTLDGRATRGKIIDSICSIVQNNAGNPDGRGQYQGIWIEDPGRDMNVPQGIPLHRTAMQIHCYWLQ